MPNRLAQETSPYLLQHRDNPVDWWPWTAEALAAAQAQDKPILLSVGYAACHWCHVMAHESFDDPEIAALMNRSFINIKVDREERPDLDAIYQQALAATGQSGGWPLTMFLTPDGRPFWGGTYFPPAPRYGRPGFPDLLQGIATIWSERRDRIDTNIAALAKALHPSPPTPGGRTLSMALLDHGAMGLLPAVDPVHGGLRGTPKFPQPGIFDYLWRAWLRTGEIRLRDAVLLTMDRICQGGVYDHLGGGLMRYSTDEVWLAPHFEKMLYDNAQFIDLLTSLWQATGTSLYRHRVAETVDWCLREMIAEDGAFAATLDADSDGQEGLFYTWKADEIARHLDPDTASLFSRAYDVTAEGNWEHGRTILRRLDHPTGAKIEDRLAHARATLWAVREDRVRPGRDDKVLADWNGMLIAALANAGFAFERPDWLDAARKAYDVVRQRMALPDHRLAHSLCQGRIGEIGLLDDLATMARAAIILAEVTGDTTYLDHAKAWVSAADRYHWDGNDGGYFQTATDAPHIIHRLKPIEDGATPSANGIMAQVLVRLWHHTRTESYLQRVQSLFDAFSTLATSQPYRVTSLLAAYEQLDNPVEIVIAGPRDRADTKALLGVVAIAPLPTRIIITGGSRTLPPHHPAHGKAEIDGATAIHVCRHQTCSPPVTSPQELHHLLRI